MKKKEINASENLPSAPKFHMEIDAGRRNAAVLIYGVRHIEEYTAEKLLLQIPGGRMKICGINLALSVFENQCVEIRGRLSEVGFLYDRT